MCSPAGASCTFVNGQTASTNRTAEELSGRAHGAFRQDRPNTLKEWWFACRKSEQYLVFPNPNGGPYSLVNVARGLAAAEIAPGLTKAGRATYPGLHSLRHFCAS